MPEIRRNNEWGWILTGCDALPELVGKVLGCCCIPLSCHSEVLSKLHRERGLSDTAGHLLETVQRVTIGEQLPLQPGLAK